MIQIHPQLENLYSCPTCDGPAELNAFVINGMRNLVDFTCPSCARSFYADVPAGHGLFYPFTIDQETLEVFEPLEPFGLVLIEACENRHTEDVELKITRNYESDDIVILNTLDYIYGHSLLKLFNAQYYMDRYPERGCCVLVPKQLAHLVPDGVAEVWEVDLPFSAYRHWWVSLDKQIQAEIVKRKSAYLAIAHPHPHHSTYSIEPFTKVAAGVPAVGRPHITFSYRTDRYWGPTPRVQRRNIIKLHSMLREAFPDMTFTLIGIGDRLTFPSPIIDRRSLTSDLDMEREWLALLSDSDCSVGVFGSNMYMPSALAQCVVEMIPEIMYRNLLQEMLLNTRYQDPYENLFRFRTLYGNDQLTDISARRVAQVVATQVSDWERFRTVLDSSIPSEGGERTGFDPRAIVEMHQKYRGRTIPSLVQVGSMGTRRKLLWALRKVRAQLPI